MKTRKGHAETHGCSSLQHTIIAISLLDVKGRIQNQWKQILNLKPQGLMVSWLRDRRQNY